MKIAVAALKKSENSPISGQAGRAPFFLIFDDTGALVETVNNPFRVGGGGAGFGVAKMLADKEVTTIVAEKFGGNMIGALQERGIEGFETSGSAAEAAMHLLEG